MSLTGPSTDVYIIVIDLQFQQIDYNLRNWEYNLNMYYVYILECSDKTLYTGSTNDLEKRLYKHNNLKSGAHYTKIRRPVVLRYFEELDTLKEARRREAELKRWSRIKKLNLISIYVKGSDIKN